jgi:hypothetical protein
MSTAPQANSRVSLMGGKRTLYPFWQQFQVGQTVNFNALAMHPFARWQGLLT